MAGVVYHLGVKMWGVDTTLDDNELFQNPLAWKNRQGDWAYKHTRMWQESDTSFTDRFIFVFRDAVASAIHGHTELNEDKMFYRHQLYSTFKTDKPHIYVSYEKLLMHTENEVKKIADFLDMPVTPEAINIVKPKGHYYNLKT